MRFSLAFALLAISLSETFAAPAPGVFPSSGNGGNGGNAVSGNSGNVNGGDSVNIASPWGSVTNAFGSGSCLYLYALTSRLRLTAMQNYVVAKEWGKV